MNRVSIVSRRNTSECLGEREKCCGNRLEFPQLLRVLSNFHKLRVSLALTEQKHGQHVFYFQRKYYLFTSGSSKCKFSSLAPLRQQLVLVSCLISFSFVTRPVVRRFGQVFYFSHYMQYVGVLKTSCINYPLASLSHVLHIMRKVKNLTKSADHGFQNLYKLKKLYKFE